MKIEKQTELYEPYIYGNEKKYLNECISRNELTFGKFSREFPKKISKLTKCKYPLQVQNGTSALYLCLRAVNIKKNDEIIVPSITFIASINVVNYCNAHPIFMDVDDTCNIDLDKTIEFLKKKTIFKNGYTFNKKTKRRISAIIVVHTFGNVVNLNRNYLNFLKKRSINIIEDAAESLGSFYIDKNKNKIHSGTIGTIGAISFNGNKIITSAGGGIVLTNNKKHFSKLNYLSNQAKDESINFIHNEIGYNFRLSNLHSAIGLAQLENLQKIIKIKKKIHHNYKKLLKNIEGLDILEPPLHSQSNYWLNILKINKNYKLNKKQIIKKLISNKINVRSIWLPNHLQRPYRKNQKYKIKIANQIYKNSLCLPSSPILKFNQLKLIIDTIHNDDF